MPQYIYNALDAQDAYTKGTIKAVTRNQAIRKLTESGLLVVNVLRKKSNRFDSLKKISTIPRADKIYLTRHLYTFLEAGIELDRTVLIASEQTENLRLKEMLKSVHNDVRQGQKLHESLNRHAKHFSPFFINFIKVGEMSGTLDSSLAHLLEQQERDHELIKKTRGALLYPMIIILAGIAIVIFMMTFVVPTIANLLQEYNTELPTATKILIATSDFLVANGLFVLAGLIVFISAFLWAIRSARGKWIWEEVLLRLPLVKRIVVEFNSARIARSICAMLKGGVSIDHALMYSEKVSNNSHYQQTIHEAITIVRKGVSLTKVWQGYPKLHPPLTIRMIEIGEQTGKTDTMFEKIANYYEKQVVNILNNLSSIIEPILLLAIGLMVGFVAISILTPIWKLAETI